MPFPSSLFPVFLLALQAHSYALPNPQAAPIAEAAPNAQAVPNAQAAPAPSVQAGPIPQAAVPTTTPTATISGNLPDITDFSSLPQSYYDAFTSALGDYSINTAELASESAEYASYTKEFYRTVHPTKLAAIESYNRVESAAYASWISDLDLFQTVGPAQLASESAEYASYTKEFYRTVHPTKLAAISSYNRVESSAFAAWTSDLYQTIGTSEYKALTSEWAQWSKEQAIYATYTGTGIPPSITDSPNKVTNGTQAEITGADGVVQDNPNVSTTVDAGPAKQTFGPLTRSQKEAAGYALTCLDSSSSELGRHEVDYSACLAVVNDICSTVEDPNIITEQWVWGDRGAGCAMGYWVGLVGEGVKVPAPMPTREECINNIFGQMRSTCIPISNGNGRWNAVSVNIAVAPTADNAGQQAEFGKPSFMLAGSPYPCGSKGCVLIADGSKPQVTA